MKTRIDRPKQPTPKELTDGLLNLIRSKWYQGDAASFAKDRSRLLSWVVLWPASWLNSRGVTISTERYREVVSKIILNAVVFGTEKVRYRPAWLKQVVQSHFRIHGDEIYAAAKSLRTLVENTILLAGRPAQAAPDPIREMAAARALIQASKLPPKRPAKEQLSLL